MTIRAERARVLQFHRASARTKAVDSIEHHDFAADIFHNPHLQPPTWHFIITHTHSPEILYWGQERSLHAARAAASALVAAIAAQALSG